jgi:hypothetical protein
VLERVGLGIGSIIFPPSSPPASSSAWPWRARSRTGPKLVLADEPTGNLDRKHGARRSSLIREVCRETGAALLLVSHDEGCSRSSRHWRRDFAEVNQALKEAAHDTPADHLPFAPPARALDAHHRGRHRARRAACCCASGW